MLALSQYRFRTPSAQETGNGMAEQQLACIEMKTLVNQPMDMYSTEITLDYPLKSQLLPS
jgi:hypothetical protein